MAEPKVFRISVGDYWGSTYPTFTSDGKTLMSDDGTIILDHAPALISDVTGFARGAGLYNPFFDFMRGRKTADIVAPDGDIVKTNSGVKLFTKDMGVIDITLMKAEGLLLPMIIDVSNVAGRMVAYRLLPMFSEKPEQPLERYVFSYKFVDKFNRDEFAIRIRKNAPVEDRRKKPK